MKRSLRFTFAVILSCQLLIGCTSWSVQSEPPYDVVRELHPDKVRIRQTDGLVFVLERPSINGDSLTGANLILEGWVPLTAYPEDSTGMTHNLPQQTSLKFMSIPTTSIDQIEVRQASTSRTVGLVLGILAGVAAINGAIVLAELGDL